MRALIILFSITLFSANVFAQVDSLTDTINIVSDSLTTVEVKDTVSTAEKANSNRVKEILETTEVPEITNVISVSKIIWSLIFLGLGYLIIRALTRMLEFFAEKSTQYRITFKSFIPIIKILGWIGVVLIILLSILKPPAATVLAFSASIGVAVGFASQDILKNIFGGIMILFDRPFQSGDKIDVGGYYGEVVEIGLRSTRIVTPDDNLVSIPNSEIMNSSVSNANAGESNCQVVAEIYLPIDADTMKARNIGMQAAQVSKYVYLNKPISVVFANEFKDRQSVYKMKIKAYVLDIRDEFKFKSEMTEVAIRELLEAGVIKEHF